MGKYFETGKNSSYYNVFSSESQEMLFSLPYLSALKGRNPLDKQ